MLSGKDKLGLISSNQLRVVLAEDGTEIDDEDYFIFLPHNTTLMVLSQGQTWRPEGAGMIAPYTAHV